MSTWKTDSWWASPYNDLESFRSKLNLPEKVIIHDATLRDGEQTPGVVFSIDEKVEIAKMLDELGVERIEAGMPAVSEADREAIRQIAKLGLKSKVFTFARSMKADIDIAKDCGANGVIIEIPTSEPKLTYQFAKWTHEDVIERSVDTIAYAKEMGMETVYFGYDTTRADFNFLKKLYATIMANTKPDSIGIVDTMGCILPGAIKELITDLKSMFDVTFEIHTHNDFGMGAAVSFAAMEAGAEVIHTCINGMGERTGNASLEQIMVGLKVLYGIDNNYRYEKIREISKKVQAFSNFHLPVNQPVVGDNIFVRESGIGVDLVLNKPLAMFAMEPSFIGHQAGFVLGKKSGTTSIEVKAKEMGLELDEDSVKKILQEVKSQGIEKKRTLFDDEFVAIVRNVK